MRLQSKRKQSKCARLTLQWAGTLSIHVPTRELACPVLQKCVVLLSFSQVYTYVSNCPCVVSCKEVPILINMESARSSSDSERRATCSWCNVMVTHLLCTHGNPRISICAFSALKWPIYQQMNEVCTCGAGSSDWSAPTVVSKPATRSKATSDFSCSIVKGLPVSRRGLRQEDEWVARMNAMLSFRESWRVFSYPVASKSWPRPSSGQASIRCSAPTIVIPWQETECADR